MTIHAEFIEDSRGDIVDVHWYCNDLCYSDGTGQHAQGHAYPCGREANYNVYCHACARLVKKGIFISEAPNGLMEITYDKDA